MPTNFLARIASGLALISLLSVASCGGSSSKSGSNGTATLAPVVLSSLTGPVDIILTSTSHTSGFPKIAIEANLSGTGGTSTATGSTNQNDPAKDTLQGEVWAAYFVNTFLFVPSDSLGNNLNLGLTAKVDGSKVTMKLTGLGFLLSHEDYNFTGTQSGNTISGSYTTADTLSGDKGTFVATLSPTFASTMVGTWKDTQGEAVTIAAGSNQQSFTLKGTLDSAPTNLTGTAVGNAFTLAGTTGFWPDNTFEGYYLAGSSPGTIYLTLAGGYYKTLTKQ